MDLLEKGKKELVRYFFRYACFVSFDEVWILITGSATSKCYRSIVMTGFYGGRSSGMLSADQQNLTKGEYRPANVKFLLFRYRPVSDSVFSFFFIF